MKESERQAATVRADRRPPQRAPAAQDVPSKISIDDFVKVELRVGQVVSAERVKGADKLLHMKVDIGEPRRAPLSPESPKPIRPSR